MALDMSKYAKMAKVERKLPIIFMINEKKISIGGWTGGMFRQAIADIMRNLSHRSVDAVMSVVSFGDEVHLWSGFKPLEEYTNEEWPKTKTSGKSSFHVALTLVKDMLEDIDTTPEGNYDPIIVLLSSDEVSPEYESALKALEKNGRFKDIQRIGITDLSRSGERYFVLNAGPSAEYEVNRRAPKILMEFAGKNVALFVENWGNESWCAAAGWRKTKDESSYTWYCPVLNMMELRYIEDGQQCANCVCEEKNDEDPKFTGFLGGTLTEKVNNFLKRE